MSSAVDGIEQIVVYGDDQLPFSVSHWRNPLRAHGGAGSDLALGGCVASASRRLHTRAASMRTTVGDEG